MSEEDLPEGWRWADFGEVAEVASDLVDPKLTPNAVHIAPNHIESWSGRLIDRGTVAGDDVKSAKHRFHAGQILYSKIRPYLAKATQVDFDGVCSADMYPIDARPSVMRPRFLLSWMLTPEFTEAASGRQGRTVLPKINQDALNGLRVPVPPLDEQQRIADRVDALRARSRRAKDALDAVPALLDRLRQSILAAAFRGDLTADWREQNPDVEPASELLKRIRIERCKRWKEAELAKLTAKGKRPKDDAWKAKYVEPEPVDETDLPELPEGWCWASLDELTDGGAPIVYGIIQPGPEVPTGVPFVRPTEMTDDGIDLTALHRCAPEVAAAYERARLTTNDVILAIVGSIGKVAEVPIELDGANITQSSARVRPAPALAAGFIAWALRSPLVRNQFAKYEFGNAVRRLNIAHVRVLAVPLAPLPEQAVVLKRARAGIDGAQRLAARAEGTRAACDGMDAAVLAAAFRGELLDRQSEPPQTVYQGKP